MFGFVASSIHIFMDVVYDVSKKVTKEIYQVVIFGTMDSIVWSLLVIIELQGNNCSNIFKTWL